MDQRIRILDNMEYRFTFVEAAATVHVCRQAHCFVCRNICQRFRDFTVVNPKIVLVCPCGVGTRRPGQTPVDIVKDAFLENEDALG